MRMIDKLTVINLSIIEYMMKKGQDYEQNLIIGKILKDRACFFKMSKEEALIILKRIGIASENYEEIYHELISKDEYIRLYQDGVISDSDQEIKVKYTL